MKVRTIAEEVKGQPRALANFAGVEFPRAPDGSVFVGAGDSYAAALAAFYASKGRCKALDPYSLASEPEIAKGLEVYFISASGRTASNVFAVRRVRRLARGTTALTAVEDSPLAKSTAKVVSLPMDYVPKTSGMLSFSLSALAAIRMVGERGPCDFAGVFDQATDDSKKMRLGQGTTYLLGNSLAHPAAVYTAAKLYELLGASAHGELLEEFSHLELLSLRKADSVNAFADFDPWGMARKLIRTLAKAGYETHAMSSRGRTPLERFFHCVFSGQLWVLAETRKAGLEEPRFLTDRRKLHASDSMIY